MQILYLVIYTIVLTATVLPLAKSPLWWIRIFDFPRIQIALITFVTIILTYIFVDITWEIKLSMISLLAIALVYQLKFVVVYTPFYKIQAKDSQRPLPENSFTLLVSNIRMENEKKERFLKLVEKVNPDLVLINEPDQRWATSISKLDENYPYAIKKPMENTFGMLFLSKFPLTESAVNFYVKDYIPSIYTRITLPSGSKIDFYGVHPEPPMPGGDTYERDTELLIVGKKIKETNHPTIVAGDLNDVGWSDTSKLFRKYSELIDPREGRGLYNTYNVNVPFFRYPLDHIFYSREFGLLTLKKLEDIGSDHYPLLISLNYEPHRDNADGLEETNAAEEEEIADKIADVTNESNLD